MLPSASSLATLLALGAAVALVPLAVVGWRWRGQPAAARLAGLTAVTLFLTLDLIAFGAYTRLADAGLGCPDWPGCFATAHPWAAQAPIEAAQALQPHGPVTWEKAWIEMLHRYLAMAVGALILVLAVASTWLRRQLPHSWAWPWATLAWVLVQGLFGKYTVTWKLYPAIVTLHLLGAVLLLALLVVQHESFRARPMQLPMGVRRAALGVVALLMIQVALGAWVSTNYAVLACQGFPQCNGDWWPAEADDFAVGFRVLRELGQTAEGGWLPFSALVAIQLMHRAVAGLVVPSMAGLLWALWRQGGQAWAHGRWLLVLMVLQVLTGIGHVVLQWPLVGALLHTTGAAAWVAVLVSLLARAHPGRVALEAQTSTTVSGTRVGAMEWSA